MLAAEPMPVRPANDVVTPTGAGPAAPAGAPGGGTLAERIRALQSHASRARQLQG
jgi:hypothetical protein